MTIHGRVGPDGTSWTVLIAISAVEIVATGTYKTSCKGTIDAIISSTRGASTIERISSSGTSAYTSTVP